MQSSGQVAGIRLFFAVIVLTEANTKLTVVKWQVLHVSSAKHCPDWYVMQSSGQVAGLSLFFCSHSPYGGQYTIDSVQVAGFTCFLSKVLPCLVRHAK